MSTQIFPSLPGISWPVKRTIQFKTVTIEATSGKEVRVALQSQPRYLYEISYEVLRSNSTTTEFQTLFAFYANRFGGYDSFLYTDPDDNTVAAQGIGAGDGFLTAFQLARAFGTGGNKWNDIILAPNVVTAVYLNGTPVNPILYTVSNWGAAIPGVITFINPPNAGQVITADFSYYWPSRFMSDTLEIEKFYQGFYSVKSLKWITIR